MQFRLLPFQAFIYVMLISSAYMSLAQSQQTQNPEAQQALQKTDHLFFIENKGQWDSDVLYLCRMGGLDAWITRYGVNYTFYQVQQPDAVCSSASSAEPTVLEHSTRNSTILGHRVLFELEGYNPEPGTESHQQQSGYYNYLLGNDASKHATDVGLYKEVVVQNVYDGIDIRYYFDRGFLRYDYIVHAGADPGKIKFTLRGSDSEYLKEGALCYTTRFGEVRMAELKTSQDDREIQSRFVQNGDAWQIALAAYDTKQTLIIDPLVYSTYIGGSNDDQAIGIAVDPSGNAYVTGYTNSTNYDVTSGSFQTTLDGGSDVIVTKLNPAGTALVYSTYIGGSTSDYGISIAIDPSGNAYVTGYTNSTNYDVTSGAFQTTNGGGFDVFVTKLNSAGTALVYSTYVGGSASDYGNVIAIDASGNAYVTGYTNSTDYDVTSGAFQTTLDGGSDVIVTKLNPSGTALVYSTYIGGSYGEYCYSIAIDPSGNAYVTGNTQSTNYDVTSGAFQTINGGSYDVFVTKLNSAGTALVYSTYIGGSSYDYGSSIAIDPSGNAYITGNTPSTNYDVTSGAFQTTNGGGDDVFVTKLNPAGTALVYSTYIGGSSDDYGSSIAIDPSGNAYVTGRTSSTNYDVTSGAFQTINGGSYDVFVTKLNPVGSALVYSTYIGGSSSDYGNSVAIDPSGNAYVTGRTNSTNYDVTSGAFQTTKGGVDDAFVTKIGDIPLAIDLISFTAEKSGQDVRIKWMTAAEKNNDYFIVERSVDAAPGDFVEIGKVDGRGDYSSLSNYSLYDRQPVMGNNYYRLKSVDKSGVAAYSKIALVHFDTDILDFNIAPNPARTEFTINFTAKQRNTYHIDMYNDMGQIVFQQDFLSNTGANTASMSPDQLCPGVYTVQLRDDSGIIGTKRLVIIE
jgi:hypothetical protein